MNQTNTDNAVSLLPYLKMCHFSICSSAAAFLTCLVPSDMLCFLKIWFWKLRKPFWVPKGLQHQCDIPRSLENDHHRQLQSVPRVLPAACSRWIDWPMLFLLVINTINTNYIEHSAASQCRMLPARRDSHHSVVPPRLTRTEANKSAPQRNLP